MKWAWRIGRVLGVDVYVHATFLILLGWVGVTHYLVGHDLRDAFNGLVFIGTVFYIVLLHELGHALAARRYGIRTGDITLLPIGGVARLDRLPEKPAQELVVALAGPAVNVALAAFFFLLAFWSDALARLTSPRLVGGPFLVTMLWLNVGMALFNLLPAFPMDGGRVLRALLALRMNYAGATRVAATIGQGFALVLGFAGLFINPLLVFVAFFVWLGAEEEAGQVEVKSELGDILIRQVMMTDFRVLTPSDPLSAAVRHILAGFQHDFPVVAHDRVVGMLTRADLLAALTRSGQDTPVGEVMRRDFPVAEATERAGDVFNRMRESECRSLPVLEGDQVVGILTGENMGEFIMIQSALRGERPG